MTTNVLWAGNIAGAPVVSIFNNPANEAGMDKPIYDRYSYLDRIYLDSRFDYLNVKWTLDFSFLYSGVSAGSNSNKITTVAYHNFGYPPVTILLDTDTREVISNNSYVQIINFSSYRTSSLIIDNNRFYIKETYDNKKDDLPIMSRRYTILAFNSSAQVS